MIKNTAPSYRCCLVTTTPSQKSVRAIRCMYPSTTFLSHDSSGCNVCKRVNSLQKKNRQKRITSVPLEVEPLLGECVKNTLPDRAEPARDSPNDVLTCVCPLFSWLNLSPTYLPVHLPFPRAYLSGGPIWIVKKRKALSIQKLMGTQYSCFLPEFYDQ